MIGTEKSAILMLSVLDKSFQWFHLWVSIVGIKVASYSLASGAITNKSEESVADSCFLVGIF